MDAPHRDPVRRLTLTLVLLALVVLVYVLFAQRLTPLSREGSVQAFLIRIAPEVAGKVSAVEVSDNSQVAAGAPLFRINPDPYRIALAQAEAHVSSVGQAIGADTAAVQTAQARMVQAKAARDNAADNAARVLELARRGVMSAAQRDQASATLAQAEAALTASEADLQRARQSLGPQGEENPRLKEAMATLAKARLDLMRTTVVAPNQGAITNIQLAPGQYAAVGTPAMTFIDTGAIWITTMLDENALEYLRAGQPAEILFDVLPGRLFKARLESLGFGSAGSLGTDQSTGLLMAPSGKQAGRQFPVTLVLDEPLPRGLRYGSQATVLFYPGKSAWMEWVGGLWLRVLAQLSYLS
ncbi:HlyD family secretion protein [Aeromonas schubertii]|uniref:HlyD family secretion protein n=1 Tax=Aeromonas schubertii TaxID=652 RepID=A0ABS7V6C7_9GAMM|nr:HlyD family secretion protein [Aeromonas schubertii]KUE81521.1 multidrug transporter [Aeromonas schubertii]MBZ6064930.1 HlyD family secretion protein [Aeromonas schubertii]QCG48492.1 HlyD family secretion protein [Aeromonas schubertii]